MGRRFCATWGARACRVEPPSCWLPSRRGKVRTREPRRPHRRGVPPFPGTPAAGCRRQRALFHRLHRPCRSPCIGGRSNPADRLCVGSGPSERTLRQRRDIPARSLCRGHQPVAAACHGSRCPSGRLRRRLQPGGGRQRSASLRFCGIGRTASRVGRGQRRLDALSWTQTARKEPPRTTGGTTSQRDTRISRNGWLPDTRSMGHVAHVEQLDPSSDPIPGLRTHSAQIPQAFRRSSPSAPSASSDPASLRINANPPVITLPSSSVHLLPPQLFSPERRRH